MRRRAFEWAKILRNVPRRVQVGAAHPLDPQLERGAGLERVDCPGRPWYERCKPRQGRRSDPVTYGLVLARDAERTDGPVGHLVAEIFDGVDRITLVFLQGQLVLPTAVALYPCHYYGNCLLLSA